MKKDKLLMDILTFASRINQSYTIKASDRFTVIGTKLNSSWRVLFPSPLDIEHDIHLYQSLKFLNMLNTLGDSDISVDSNNTVHIKGSVGNGTYHSCHADIIPETPTEDIRVDDFDCSFTMSNDLYNSIKKTSGLNTISFIVDDEKQVIRLHNPETAGSPVIDLDISDNVDIKRDSVELSVDLNEFMLFPTDSYTVELSNVGAICVHSMVGDVDMLYSIAANDNE